MLAHQPLSNCLSSPLSSPARRRMAAGRSHWRQPAARGQSEPARATNRKASPGDFARQETTIFIYEEITVVYHYCN